MRLVRFAFVLSTVISFGGCGVPVNVIARVGVQNIELERAQAYIEAVTGADWQDADARVASRLLDEFLEQAAVSLLMDESDFLEDVDPGQRWNAVRRFSEENCGPVPTVAPQDFRRAVEIRLTEVVPKQVLLRQLLLGDSEVADEAYRRLSAGDDFIDVSREFSRAPNAEGGGDLGWVVQGTQPEDIEEVIFALAEGEISRPTEGPGGFHLFQALEVRASGHPPRDQVEREIRRGLEDQLSRDHLRRCITGAVKEIGVEVFSENLWFEYKGQFAEAINGK